MLDFLSNFKGRLILLEALFFYYLILSHTVIHIFHRNVHSFGRFFHCHSAVYKTLTYAFHILSNLNNMFIRLIKTDNSLSQPMLVYLMKIVYFKL